MNGSHCNASETEWRLRSFPMTGHCDVHDFPVINALYSLQCYFPGEAGCAKPQVKRCSHNKKNGKQIGTCNRYKAKKPDPQHRIQKYLMGKNPGVLNSVLHKKGLTYSRDPYVRIPRRLWSSEYHRTRWKREGWWLILEAGLEKCVQDAQETNNFPDILARCLVAAFIVWLSGQGFTATCDGSFPVLL